MPRQLCRTAVLIILPLLTTAARAVAQPPSTASARILVMPFENVTRNSKIFWLGEAAAVLVADDLNALGGDAITREERRHAFERLQVPPAAALTDATIIRIGQIVGAADVVVGSIELDGETLVVRARSIALEPGRVQASVVERGSMPELFGIFERVARRLVPPAAAAAETIPLRHPSLPVFENYIKGLLADSAPTAIRYLSEALKLDPAFDRARLALWDVYEDQGEHARALDAVKGVAPAGPLGRRAQFLAALALVNLKRYDDAFAAFKGLADARPTAVVFNNLGVVQLRRGTVTPQAGQPVYYFNKAAELDPDDPDYFFNLGYAYWMARDTQAAIYWLREAVRRNAADGDAHFVLGAALAAAANASEAAREKELAKRLSSTYAEWEKRPAADPVPRGLERVKSDVELPRARSMSAAITTSGQRDQKELTRFYVDRARRLFDQENDRDALLELNRALYLSPYDAEAHLLVGRIHLRNGRVHQAIDAFKISLWSDDTADGHAALGEAYRQAKDAAAARSEADRALALDPDNADAKRLVERLQKGAR